MSTIVSDLDGFPVMTSEEIEADIHKCVSSMWSNEMCRHLESLPETQ